MSYGLFEELSIFDEGKRTSKRQAVAVAHKRVSDLLGDFLKTATTTQDRKARLALVQGEIRQVVAEVAEEYDADKEALEKAIQESLGDGVTDIDGALKDAPSAVGSRALSSEKTALNPAALDPGMLGGMPPPLQGGQPSGPMPPAGAAGPTGMPPQGPAEAPAYGPAQGAGAMAPAIPPPPHGVQQGVNPTPPPVPPQGTPPPPATPGLLPNLLGSQHTAEYTVEQLEDGSGKFKIVGPTGGSEGVEDSRQEAQAIADEKNKTSSRIADADRDGGGAVKSEDLPKANDAGDLGGPSPKIDHTTWKPNALNDSGNVKPIDTEQDGSPVPSVTQDVTDTPDWKGDFLRDTDAVTEEQNLPTANDDAENTTRNIEQPHTDTFNNNGQADPVTSEVFSRTALSPENDPEAAQNQQDKYDFKDQQRVRGEEGMNPTYEVTPATEEHCDALGNCGADYIRQGIPVYTVLKNGQPHTMFDENGTHVDKGHYPVSEGPAAELAAPYQASVDPDRNPIRDILESGMPTDHQVQAAITEFENEQS